jgi:hypothetical protein
MMIRTLVVCEKRLVRTYEPWTKSYSTEKLINTVYD